MQSCLVFTAKAVGLRGFRRNFSDFSCVNSEMDILFIQTEVESETLLTNKNRHFLSGDKEAVNRRHTFISFWSLVYGIFSSEAENNLQYQTFSRLIFYDWQGLTCMTGWNFYFFWKKKTKLVKIPKKTERCYRGFLSSVSPDRQHHSCLQQKEEENRQNIFFVFHEWTLNTPHDGSTGWKKSEKSWCTVREVSR